MTKDRLATVQPWFSLLIRVAMAVILVFAALPKFADLDGSVRAVRAYRILPEALTPFAGYMLPFAEIVLALVLLAGIFTRVAAIAWVALMAAFTFGISWAWAQGYQIDCGCFSAGGDLPDGETANYTPSLLLRGLFLAMGAYLWWMPRSRWSLDGWLNPQDVNLQHNNQGD